MHNPLKQMIANDTPVWGTMLQEMTSPGAPQLLNNAGFDWFVIDCEHSWPGLERCAWLIRVARAIGFPIFFRISRTVGQMLSRLLDIGATGLIVPYIENAEQAQEVVNWAKYQPTGQRGRASGVGLEDYERWPLPEALDRHDAYTMVVVQIESKTGVDNCSEIFAVEGIDACFVGPADLSLSLGVPGQREHPDVTAAIHTVFAAAQASSVAPGIHMKDVDQLRYWVAQGGLFMAYSSDISMITQASTQVLAQLRASDADTCQ